jgi:hypothetical protein
MNKNQLQFTLLNLFFLMFSITASASETQSWLSSNCNHSKFMLINNTSTPFTVEAIQPTDNGSFSIKSNLNIIPAHGNLIGEATTGPWSAGNSSGIISLHNEDGYLELIYDFKSTYGMGTCRVNVELYDHLKNVDQYNYSTALYDGKPAFASFTIDKK